MSENGQTRRPTDASETFMQDKELGAEESFTFACHPGVECFNACCSGLVLNLTPYDALRLRRNLGRTSRDFVRDLCLSAPMPGTGLPMLRLRMLDDPGKSCPFVRAEGCAVYPDRPSSCRGYPVGRATRSGEAGLSEKFFLMREAHCKGFGEDRQWTPAQWMADQGLAEYNRANDRFTGLASAMTQAGASLDPGRANMAMIGLYHTDDFLEFLTQMNILDKVELDAGGKERILEDEEARLDFALDWVELLALGPNAARLKPRGS